MEEHEGCRECGKYETCSRVYFLRTNEPRGTLARERRRAFYKKLAEKCRSEGNG